MEVIQLRDYGRRVRAGVHGQQVHDQKPRKRISGKRGQRRPISLDRTRRRSPSSLAYLLVKRSIATHSPFMSHTRCAHDTLALPNGNDRIACDRLRVHLDFSRRSRCVLSIWRRRSDMLSRRLLRVVLEWRSRHPQARGEARVAPLGTFPLSRAPRT